MGSEMCIRDRFAVASLSPNSVSSGAIGASPDAWTNSSRSEAASESRAVGCFTNVTYANAKAEFQFSSLSLLTRSNSAVLFVYAIYQLYMAPPCSIHVRAFERRATQGRVVPNTNPIER